MEFILTPGNNHDITHAENLTKNLRDTTIIADKGYDSQVFEGFLLKSNWNIVIPSRKTNKKQREIYINKDTYKLRHFIETLFSKIKYFRRIFTRFDTSVSSYIS